MSTTDNFNTENNQIKRQPSLVANDPKRFEHGVLIRGKFIGVEDVKQESGDEICQTSMVKLKAVVLAKKEHKQRICIRIDLDGVEILDEKTNSSMYKHSVNHISYIARDVNDARAIGYIYKSSPSSFQYFAIKTQGQAQELFNTLRDLFEVVLEMRNAKKNEQKQQQQQKSEQTQAQSTPYDSSKTEEPKKTNENSLLDVGTNEKSQDDQLISDLQGKIEQMKVQPNLIDTGEIDQEKNLADSSFEKSLETGQPSSSNELFNIFNSSVPTTTSVQQNLPLDSNLASNSSNLSSLASLNSTFANNSTMTSNQLPQKNIFGPPLPNYNIPPQNNPFGISAPAPAFAGMNQPAATPNYFGAPNMSNPFGVSMMPPQGQFQPMRPPPIPASQMQPQQQPGIMNSPPVLPPMSMPASNPATVPAVKANAFDDLFTMPTTTQSATQQNSATNNNQFPW